MLESGLTQLPRLTKRILGHEILRPALLLTVAALLADWASKSWALDRVDDALVPLGALTLGVVRNEAFAFSMGAGNVSSVTLMSLRLVALTVFAFYCWQLAPAWSRRNAFGLALVVAGGFGNTIDLIFRGGAVVDFIGAGPFFIDWAGELVQLHLVFNTADLLILIGIALLAPLIRLMGRRVQQNLAVWERSVLSRFRSPPT